MGWLLGILIILLAITGYMLFAPLYIEVDSEEGLCRVRFHRLASVGLILTQDIVGVKWRFAFWGKTFDILSAPDVNRKEEREEKEKKPTQAKPKSRRRVPWRKIWSVLGSFKVRKCVIHVDTGDMPTNGILYPVILWLGARSKKDIRINFVGENEVALRMENSLGRMIWAYVKG